MGSSGPHRALGALMKSVGSFGNAMLTSAAWSVQLRPMQTIFPMPASGQPRRGRPRTTGERERSRRRSCWSAAGASTSGVTSLMTRERSRSFPSASIAPGRSAPGRPYRMSFIGPPLRILRVPHADDLADQRGLRLALDLDRHLGSHAHAVAGHFVGADDPLAHADAGARRHGADEPDFVL